MVVLVFSKVLEKQKNVVVFYWSSGCSFSSAGFCPESRIQRLIRCSTLVFSLSEMNPRPASILRASWMRFTASALHFIFSLTPLFWATPDEPPQVTYFTPAVSPDTFYSTRLLMHRGYSLLDGGLISISRRLPLRSSVIVILCWLSKAIRVTSGIINLFQYVLFGGFRNMNVMPNELP